VQSSKKQAGINTQGSQKFVHFVIRNADFDVAVAVAAVAALNISLCGQQHCEERQNHHQQQQQNRWSGYDNDGMETHVNIEQWDNELFLLLEKDNNGTEETLTVEDMEW
jgi:hypothetical protein